MMIRQRKQSGYVYQRGGWWILRYRENLYENGQVVRRQMAKQLEPVAPEHRRLKRPPPSVERLAEAFLIPLNSKAVNVDSTRTIGGFVEGFYLPSVLQNQRLSTHKSYRNVWHVHLEKPCGQARLRDFTTYDGEQLLQAIARQGKLAKNTLKQIKSLMSGIFKEAKRMKFVTSENPMRDVSIPNAKAHGRETGFYSLEEELKMLAVLPEPERSIVGVAAFSGLRRGEIRGLEWQHYTGEALTVEQSIYDGRVTAPKSEASRASVPVIAPLRKILDQHHALSACPTSGYIFPARNGKSLSLNNALRQILPALKAAGIKWCGWHAFRRGLATNLHALGVDDITIQHILRHSDITTTRTAYIKTLSQQIVDGMKTLETAWDKVAAEPPERVSSRNSTVQ